MVPKEVVDWLEKNNFGSIVSSRSVAGGCINNGISLRTTSGKSFFLKTNYNAPANMFTREAEGLEALRVDDGPVVPKPFIHGAEFILMEELAPAQRKRDYWQEFGRQLAALHNYTNPRFGFFNDNYIGSTPQPNAWAEDGYQFFAEQRLLFQAHLANERGLLSRSDVRKTETLALRLPEIVPEQSASLIHGDLWSGNAISDANGDPAIIDPATHFGWAEAELAMTALFGSFPREFYSAYCEGHPLEKGYEDRYAVYNLYHLLNHLNLFGRGYLGQVQSILRRYVS